MSNFAQVANFDDQVPRIDPSKAAMLLIDHQTGLLSLVLEEGYDIFVVTDASGTFNELTRDSAWRRMEAAGAQLMTSFSVLNASK